MLEAEINYPSYSGLGDRHQQVVDGVTTNYTLDLNTGLTQVLDDGTNTYLYGNGRIAQAGGTTEYFLGDALGSVRQLADSARTVTLTQSYAPFGDTISSTGSGTSAYQFTGEMRDASGLTYLRARYIDSGTGRFISRDTWAGNYNRPLSLNRWNYTEGNPVNFTDPTGYKTDKCEYNPSKNMDYIEKHVKPFLSTSSELGTYTAAGIAVQCWAEGSVIDNNNDPYDGEGPGQISDNQTSYEWEKKIDDGKQIRGNGLRCYIVKEALSRNGLSHVTVCECEEWVSERFSSYQLEDPHNQNEMIWAVEYMRRRIKVILDVCENERGGCLTTDRYIVAALAQNGTYLSSVAMKVDVPKLDNPTPSYRMNWVKYFDEYDSSPIKKNTRVQLRRFSQAIIGLRAKGWHVPQIDETYINRLVRYWE